MVQLDATIGKTFAFSERVRFELKADAFNSLNHPIYNSLVTNYASSSFGELTSATAPIFDKTGRAIAALSVSSPIQRMTPGREQQIQAAVLQAGARATAAVQKAIKTRDPKLT